MSIHIASTPSSFQFDLSTLLCSDHLDLSCPLQPPRQVKSGQFCSTTRTTSDQIPSTTQIESDRFDNSFHARPHQYDSSSQFQSSRPFTLVPIASTSQLKSSPLDGSHLINSHRFGNLRMWCARIFRGEASVHLHLLTVFAQLSPTPFN